MELTIPCHCHPRRSPQETETKKHPSATQAESSPRQPSYLIRDRSGGSSEDKAMVVRVTGPVGLNTQWFLIFIQFPLPEVA